MEQITIINQREIELKFLARILARKTSDYLDEHRYELSDAEFEEGCARLAELINYGGNP